MPRFKAKYRIQDDKFRKTLIELNTDPRVIEFTEILEDYIETSRKRYNNAWALTNLQLHILQDLAQFETAKKVFKKNRLNVGQNNMQSGEREKHSQMLDVSINIYDIYCKVLREVVDGLAWRMFDYDRGILQYLTQTRPTVQINLEGIEGELSEWITESSQNGKHAILTCLSNFITIGDVIVKEDTDAFEIVEVKSRKKRGSRITRQRNKLYETVDILNAGNDKINNIVFYTLDTSLDNYLMDLKEAIDRAYLYGHAVKILDETCILQCFYMDGIQDIDAAIKESDDVAKPLLKEWRAKGNRIVHFYSLDRFNVSRNFAPLTIFPLASKSCADIMLGRVQLYVTVNISKILNKFESAGWRIVYNFFNEKPEQLEKMDVEKVQFFVVEKNGFMFSIPPSLLVRIGHELLKPDALVNIAEEVKKRSEISKKDEKCLMSFSKESAIWN